MKVSRRFRYVNKNYIKYTSFQISFSFLKLFFMFPLVFEEIKVGSEITQL